METEQEINRLGHEINRLSQENNELRQQLSLCVQTMNQIFTSLGGRNDEIVDALNRNVAVLRNNFENLRYELCDPYVKTGEYFYPQFRSNEETLRLIIEEGKSLARFGDAEFSICGRNPRHKYQRFDERLAQRIEQVLSSFDNPNLLIGIADNYGNLDKYGEEYADAIRNYMTYEVRAQHEMLLPMERIYTDAYMTRPYLQYKDKFTDAPKKRFEALRRIWEGKKLLIVEGAYTRLGMGNDLFDNASSIGRIIAPPTSSFDRYDDILEGCKKHARDADLFILAIGPSSGVLAYDLTIEGYQAVDVGHIDLEYEWMKAGKGIRTAVPNKYNNEVAGGDQVDVTTTPLYDAQILEAYI